MNINGLQSDRYFINNPIYLRIFELGTDTLDVSLSITLGTISNTYKFYPSPSNNEIVVDIAPLIKGMFPKPIPNHNYTVINQVINTIQPVIIAITAHYASGYNESASYTKRFIRGGKRGQDNNVVRPLGSLKVTDRIPVWIGYPCANYQLQNDSGHIQIVKQNIDSNATSWEGLPVRPRRQITRTSNGAYIKFLNLNGGYSYWLFEVNETKIKSKAGTFYTTPSYPLSGFTSSNSDAYIQTGITDMGGQVEESLQVETVMTDDYIELMKNLVYSNDVYLYTGNDLRTQRDNQPWERLISTANNITYDNNKRVYNVSFTFDILNTLNPSLI